LKGSSIEVDRTRLFNEWGFFRGRIRQQRSEGKRSVQRALLPMLSELLEELREGFACSGLTVEHRFGRTSVTMPDGRDVEEWSRDREEG